MNPGPLISCIVPTFNAAEYLTEAINSILGQTWRPLEIIIADDGSTDETQAIAARYDNVAQFYTQATAGPAATRNLGLRHAQGDFIAFLDPDDLWHPDKLTRQMAEFQNDPDLSLCITYVSRFWSASLHQEELVYHHHPRNQAIPGYATPALLARRSVFQELGDFNPNLWFSDATEWFLRAKLAGFKLAIITDVLTYHRMHDHNLTRRHSQESKQEFLQLVKTALAHQRKP